MMKLKEVLLRTYPDEICYDKDIRHLVYSDDKLTITDFLDHPFLSINLDALKNGVLSVDNCGHDLLHRYDDEIKIIQ